jgi:hypothetical protein
MKNKLMFLVCCALFGSTAAVVGTAGPASAATTCGTANGTQEINWGIWPYPVIATYNVGTYECRDGQNVTYMTATQDSCSRSNVVSIFYGFDNSNSNYGVGTPQAATSFKCNLDYGISTGLFNARIRRTMNPVFTVYGSNNLVSKQYNDICC